MWALLIRELRVNSRRWSTYWLRVLAGALACIAVLFWLGENDQTRAIAGSELFSATHRVIFVAIWVIVPLMSCDCLSQERREGTLGLLFMSNLTAAQIVSGKAVLHGLRALALWGATVPLTGLALLLGGLTPLEFAVSCLLSFTAIAFALAAGVIASSFTERFGRAVAMSVVFAVQAAVCFSLLLSIAIYLAVEATSTNSTGWSRSPMGFNPGWNVLTGWMSESMLELVLNPRWLVYFFTPGTGSSGFIFVAVLGAVLLPASMLVLAAGIGMAAFLSRRTWNDKPKSARQVRVEKTLFEPRFAVSLLKRMMARRLDGNPIGWLELRNWSGRMTALVWLAIMVSFASTLFGNPVFWSSDVLGAHLLDWLLFAFLLSMAYVAANSFRRERETGAMELLLVTPLKERQILEGRLRGLWMQFLPSLAIWIAVKAYAIVLAYKVLQRVDVWDGGMTLQLLAGYILIPVIGLHFSLTCRVVLLGWLATMATWYLTPMVVVHASVFASRWLEPPWVLDLLIAMPSVVKVLVQSAVALALGYALHRRLVRRTFSLRIA